MSNRDKFLLVVIGIAGVILLPYFLYIKDTRDRITNLDNEIVQLTDRYNQLLEYEKNREMYEEGIVKYTEMRDEIIAKYPADIQQASQVMYLLNTEYSESIEYTNADVEDRGEVPEITVVEPTVRFTSGKFAGSVALPINSQLLATEGEENPAGVELVETEYVALTNMTELTFNCIDQPAINHLLGYIRDDEDNPMIYRKIELKMDQETGQILGSMSLYQYAITGGEDREFVPLPVIPNIDEHNMRGNEEYGIFGPWNDRLYWEWRAAQEAEENGEVVAPVDDED